MRPSTNEGTNKRMTGRSYLYAFVEGASCFFPMVAFNQVPMLSGSVLGKGRWVGDPSYKLQTITGIQKGKFSKVKGSGIGSM
jgi:hypothetical protein